MTNRGFTLIELLITIIILSILSIALIPMTTSILRATFIETPSAMSKAEATFLLNSRFIDALYPMQFAVCTYTSASRDSNNITDTIEIYTATSLDTSDVITQLKLKKQTIQNHATFISVDGKQYPAIPGISVNNIELFYGDKIIKNSDVSYKPFSNLSIHYTATTRDNQQISATVGITKITSPFPLPIACFDADTYTATVGRVIYIYFTQPIIYKSSLENSPPDYLTVRCDGTESTINEITYHGPNPSYLTLNIDTNTPVNPTQCTVIFKDSNTIESYERYTISDLVNVLDNHTPYIEVMDTCP